jgi:hypothetical protein
MPIRHLAQMGSPFFYQSFCDIIFSYFMKLIFSFYEHSLNLKRINLASLCLIPKKNDANIITQYMSISIINYSVKIITKAFTERLTPLMDSFITHTQTAYVKGSFILDNVMCVHDSSFH